MSKYDEMKARAIDMLKEDDDLFCAMVDELDSWNGYADGFRAYPMNELDDLFCGCRILEVLDKLGDDFDASDEFFYCSVYGIESTDDKAELYRDNVDSEELLDEILDYHRHLWMGENAEFSDLIDALDCYDEEEEEEEEEEEGSGDE